MALFNDAQCELAELVSRLIDCNPFLPERRELERQILGSDFDASSPDIWSNRPGFGESPNIHRVAERVAELVAEVRAGWEAGKVQLNAAQRRLYEDSVLVHLYHTYRDRLHQTVQERTTKVPYWKEFAGDCQGFLGP